MDKSKIFYTCDRAEWRAWLEAHYKTDSEIWFVFPTKDANEPSLSYNDAVEEALCFGWIDSTTGHIDDLHGVRRFTPRRPGSSYSRPNIERLLWLDKRGMIHPSVRESVADLIYQPYVFPNDIIEKIKENPNAWENYCEFSESYRRIRIAYIDAARERPQEFAKRLESFISKTQAGKLIVGFGGIDKYYNINGDDINDV